MKKIITVIISAMGFMNAFAQKEVDLGNEKELRELLNKSQFSIDANAQAVILSRKIKADITYKKITHDAFNENYEYTIDFTAKILSEEAATDLSLINIPRTYGTTIASISADVYNLDGQNIKKSTLASDDIMRENLTNGIDVIKFNLPGVKKGSVIHYTYKTLRPIFFDVPDQYLQLQYPIEYETYEISIPYFFTCKTIDRINAPLVKAVAIDQLKTCEACYWQENYGGESSPYYKWARRNVPAFKKEPFMGGEDNYKERIKLQLESVLIGGIIRNYLDDWDNFSKNFLYSNENYIAQAFKSNAFLSDKVDELTKNKASEMEKARAIYSFVRDSCNTRSQEQDFSIKSAFNNKSGSNSEINLLLVAMLRRAHLNSSPILLSPKPKEKLNPIFPDNNNLSVLIASVELDKKTVYLDATKKHLSFGMLPPDDYNGYARLVSEKNKGIELEPNMVTEKSATVGKIKQGENPNQLLITMDMKLGSEEAYKFREEMTNDTDKIRKAIINSYKDDYQGITISKLKIENLENPDLDLKIHFEATLDLANASTIYLNPYFDKFIEKNPFTAPQRTYPIELERKENKAYVLNIELPKEYVIDDYPKSSIRKFDSAGSIELKNIFTYDIPSNTFSITSNFRVNECNYPANYYEGVKAFYDKCVEAQNQKIVIKKIDAK